MYKSWQCEVCGVGGLGRYGHGLVELERCYRTVM